MPKYTASSLAEIAEAFETFASDQIGCIRMQSTKKAKDECRVRADVWNDAASMLRNVNLVTPTEGMGVEAEGGE